MKRIILFILIIGYSLISYSKVSIGDEFIYEGLRFRVTCLNPEEVYVIGPEDKYNISGAIIPEEVKNETGRIFTVVGICSNAFSYNYFSVQSNYHRQ